MTFDINYPCAPPRGWVKCANSTTRGDAKMADQKVPYVAPRLTELGKVEQLTQVQDKKLGRSDGFTFMGVPITNAS